MNIPGRKYFKDEAVFSDWFPRGGDDALFRAERIDHIGTTVSVKIEFFTKNREDQGDGLPIVDDGGTNLDLTLLGGTSDPSLEETLIRSVDAEFGSSPAYPRGFRELVRLKVTVPTGSSGDWMLARVFPPIFFDRCEVDE